MQNTTNAFLEGIITDQNPLTMPETAMTSALNATFLTLNGNELLLLNDMGNTLIKDSITGNVMALSDGFIPLGMKEHGGVLYIASYNPGTGEGELGTIPSPILHYTFDSMLSLDINLQLTNLNEDNVLKSETTVGQRIKDELIYVISDHLFHGGDKFIVTLNIDGINNTYDRSYRTLQDTIHQTLTYPLISSWDNTGKYKKGWFRIELYAVTESQSPIEMGTVIQQRLEYTTTDGVSHMSNYWFVSSSDLGDAVLDPDKTRLTNQFKTFPNIPAGRLAIKIVPEYPQDLLYIVNQTYGMKVPTVQVEYDGNSIKNWVSFPGFTYIAEGAILPDLIIIECNKGTVPIYYGKNPLQSTNSYEVYIEPFTNGGTPNTDKKIFPCVDPSLVVPKLAVSNKAFCTKLLNTENGYLISKYKPLSETYPARNYQSNNNDGLFFVLLDNLNTELIIRIKRYVKYEDSYVLYQDDNTVDGWLYMDPFNPTLMAVSNSSITPVEEVIPNISFLDLAEAEDYLNKVGYIDPVLGKETADTFDVEFYTKSPQKCFVYDYHSAQSIDVNLYAIKAYDKKAHKYRWREVLQWQGYVNELEEFGYDPKVCGYDEHAYTRQSSPFGTSTNKTIDVQAAFVPDKSNATSGVRHSLLAYENLRTWIYPLYTASLNQNKQVQDESSIEFIWNTLFQYSTGIDDATYNKYYNNDLVLCVVSSSIPTVDIIKGGEQTPKHLLLPIDNNFSLYDFLQEVENLLKHFKEKYNSAGLNADGMKKYCLYLTNLHTLNDSDYSTVTGFSADFADRKYIWLYDTDEYKWGNSLYGTASEGFWRYTNPVERLDDDLSTYTEDSCLFLVYKDDTYSITNNDDRLGLSLGHCITGVATTRDEKESTFRTLLNLLVRNGVLNDYKKGMPGVISYLSHEDFASGLHFEIGKNKSKPSQTSIGLVNNLVKKCPGYISVTDTNPIVELLPINFKFPLSYLYKEKNNFGNNLYHVSVINKNPNPLLIRSFIGAIVGSTNHVLQVGMGISTYSEDEKFSRAHITDGQHLNSIAGYNTYKDFKGFNLQIDITSNDRSDVLKIFPKGHGFININNLNIWSLGQTKQLEVNPLSTTLELKIDIHARPHDVDKSVLKYCDSGVLKNKVDWAMYSSADLAYVKDYFFLGRPVSLDETLTTLAQLDSERKHLLDWVNDLLITVYSPQLFTDLSDTSLKNIPYLSNYKMATILGVKNNNASSAFYYNNGSYTTIVSGSNVDKQNKLLLNNDTAFFPFDRGKSPSKIYTSSLMTAFDGGGRRLAPRIGNTIIPNGGSSVSDSIYLPIYYRNWGINTFCNEDTTFYLILGDKKDLTYTIDLTTRTSSQIQLEGLKLYVLNVNYNQLKQRYFKLLLNINGRILAFPDSRSFLIFYIPTSTSVSLLQLIINVNEELLSNNTPAYIKNIGLMEILNTADNELPEGCCISDILANCSSNSLDSITALEDTLINNCWYLYDSVLFEPVFCYKEEQTDGSKIGCMDYEYSGFLALPEAAYLKCMDVFRYDYRNDKILFGSQCGNLGYLREHPDNNETDKMSLLISNLNLSDYNFRTLREE